MILKQAETQSAFRISKTNEIGDYLRLKDQT